MPTNLNLSIIKGAAKEFEFEFQRATQNDRVWCNFYNGRDLVIYKASEKEGGSSNEIEIITSGEKKYIVKVNVVESSKLWLSNVTYQFYRINELEEIELLYYGVVNVQSQQQQEMSPIYLGTKNIEIWSLMPNPSDFRPNDIIFVEGKLYILKNASWELFGEDKTDIPINGTNDFIMPQLEYIIGANFRGQYLVSASLKGQDGINYLFCDFRNINGVGLMASGCLFMACRFDNSLLSEADFSGSQFDQCTFKNTLLMNTNLSNTNLNGANLTGANLNGANLAGANLNGANLTGANLDNAVFDNTDLIGANLTGANLPDYIGAKEEFRAFFGIQRYDPETTIWVDGNPIG